MRGQFLARGTLFGGIGRQQQPRFQKGQPGGHDQVIGRQFDAQGPRLFDEGQVLLGQFQDRDLAQVHLLGARER